MDHLYIPLANDELAHATAWEEVSGQKLIFDFPSTIGPVLYVKDPIGFSSKMHVSLDWTNGRIAALRQARVVAAVLQLRYPGLTDVDISVQPGADYDVRIQPDGTITITLPDPDSPTPTSRFVAQLKLFQAWDKSTPLCPASPSSLPQVQHEDKPARVLLFRNHYVRSGAPWAYSSATQYLAGAMREANVPFDILDWRLRDGSPQDLKDQITALPHTPNLIAITLFARSELEMNTVIKTIRQVLPNCAVAIGGVAPTLIPEQAAAAMEGADIFVRGEGEDILPELARRLGTRGRDALDDLDVRSLPGTLVFGENVMRSERMTVINQYTQDHVPFDLQSLSAEDLKTGLCIYLTRGCRNYCSFCSAPFHGAVRVPSDKTMQSFFQSVMQRLHEAYDGDIPPGAKNVTFIDDDLFSDIEGVSRMAEIIHQTGLRVCAFQTGIRMINKATRDQIERFFNYDKGTYTHAVDYVYIGVENTVDEELAYLGKGYGYAKIKEALETLKTQRIKDISLYRIDHNSFTTPEYDALNNQRFRELENLYDNVTSEGAGHALNTNHYAPLFLKRLRRDGGEGLVIDDARSVLHKHYPELSLRHFLADVPLLNSPIKQSAE
ncbi:cobalamin-dependent protein [Magnetovibrio sp. PR-2]|uniref:B12-binding domain-containing radical SAM protein n=1 Tax=Magnetovibrio sp. PR-2 TaxID=3120356 RepID=UPI002FCDE64D